MTVSILEILLAVISEIIYVSYQNMLYMLFLQNILLYLTLCKSLFENG